MKHQACVIIMCKPFIFDVPTSANDGLKNYVFMLQQLSVFHPNLQLRQKALFYALTLYSVSAIIECELIFRHAHSHTHSHRPTDRSAESILGTHEVQTRQTYYGINVFK